MKRSFILVPVAALVALLCNCTSRPSDTDAEGYVCLSNARKALAAHDFALAKAWVDSLRTQYPTALNAREDAILFLDSVGLAEAHVEVAALEEALQQPDLTRIGKDTLDFNYDEAKQKVRFFEKKLEHDKANHKQHK
ncbi:MAG: hypothetical protein ILA34_07020 [Bacteroidaceae bacterium]|nr:hypothetical protein [Bacteroidaceae bacterium]